MRIIAVVREELRLVRRYERGNFLFPTLTLLARRFAPRPLSPLLVGGGWALPLLAGTGMLR